MRVIVARGHPAHASYVIRWCCVLFKDKPEARKGLK